MILENHMPPVLLVLIAQVLYVVFLLVLMVSLGTYHYVIHEGLAKDKFSTNSVASACLPATVL